MPDERRESSRHHFKNYRSTGDEVFDASGVPHPSHRRLVNTFRRYVSTSLEARQRRLDRSSQEIGSQFGINPMEESRLSDWSLDIFPRLLDPAEWDLVRRGVLQRGRAFDALVRDIYNNREILKDRILPAEVILKHPDFHRPLSGLIDPEDPQILVGAVDLIRTVSGEWQVVENHFGSAEGIATVIHNRRMLVQAFPELFAGGKVEPVASFTARLVEALRSKSKKKRPFIVLLSRGEAAGTYFEDSFIARHMGIEMVKPPDLTVRDGQIHYRTINGLEPVDVVYRRLETGSLDPVSFPNIPFNGIPGILNSYRVSPFTIVNGLGAAIADNRSLLSYSNAIIRYYLNEEPILKTVKTWDCGDPDQASIVFEKPLDFFLKPISSQQTLARQLSLPYLPVSQEALGNLFKIAPYAVVAQQFPPVSTMPVFRSGVFSPEATQLRSFFLLGPEPYTLPGGLTLVPPRGRVGEAFSMAALPEMKDTWLPAVKGRDRTSPAVLELLEPEIAPGELPIGSRVAEAMYWMGRYVERAQNTARMLIVLDSIRYDELSSAEQNFYWPLWQSVASATHQVELSNRKQPPRNTQPYAYSLLFEPSNSGSVFSSLKAAEVNAGSIREAISPEFWQAIKDLVNSLHRDKKLAKTSDEIVQCQEILNAADSLWGTGERTLLHDAGWAFFRFGAYMERFEIHLGVLRSILPRAVKNQIRHQADDTDLTSLLRLLGSLDAYRREYRSRAYLDRLVRLFWSSSHCPSSLRFCCERMKEQCALIMPLRSKRYQILFERLDQLSASLESLPLQNIFPGRASDLDKGATTRRVLRKNVIQHLDEDCGSLQNGLAAIHAGLEELIFYHKAARPGFR